MAKGKLSPRQKMINLMYLIFIAMLALNVDREVLRSFADINNTLEDGVGLTTDNNKTFYDLIETKAQEDATYDSTRVKANELRGITDQFVTYIGGLKDRLKGDDYKVGEDTNYNALQDSEPITSLFFKKAGGGTDDRGNKEAEEFVKNIETYKQELVKYGGDPTRIDVLFNTEKSKGSVKKNWVSDKFYGQPMVAALTNLTKIQADARTEEGNIVKSMLSTKLIKNLEFTSTALLVSVPGVIQVGNQQNAFVAVGAYSGETSGTINVNGQSYSLTGGKATIPLNTSPGEYTFAGNISYTDPNGKVISEQFSEPYKVVSEVIEQTPPAPEGGTISADKMNVVYLGVDNPLTASLNGVRSGISMSPSSGSLSGSNGKYVFRPAPGNREVTFTATGKTATGQTVTTKNKFRVKPVPPATGQIRNKSNVSMPASSISKQKLTVAWPSFEFPVTGTVTSFKVKVPGQLTKVVNGNSLAAAKSVLDKAKKGSVVGIFDIKYKDSSGAPPRPTSNSVIIEVK